jgi:hypothetical protein
MHSPRDTAVRVDRLLEKRAVKDLSHSDSRTATPQQAKVLLRRVLSGRAGRHNRLMPHQLGRKIEKRAFGQVAGTLLGGGLGALAGGMTDKRHRLRNALLGGAAGAGIGAAAGQTPQRPAATPGPQPPPVRTPRPQQPAPEAGWADLGLHVANPLHWPKVYADTLTGGGDPNRANPLDFAMLPGVRAGLGRLPGMAGRVPGTSQLAAAGTLLEAGKGLGRAFYRGHGNPIAGYKAVGDQTLGDRVPETALAGSAGHAVSHGVLQGLARGQSPDPVNMALSLGRHAYGMNGVDPDFKRDVVNVLGSPANVHVPTQNAFGDAASTQHNQQFGDRLDASFHRANPRAIGFHQNYDQGRATLRDEASGQAWAGADGFMRLPPQVQAGILERMRAQLPDTYNDYTNYARRHQAAGV